MLIPVLHRVLVKPEKVEDTDDLLKRAKALGIQVEIDKREQAGVEIGTVVAIGSTAFRDFGGAEDTLQLGAKVYFAKYAGKTVKDGEEEFLLLNDEDIVALIKE